METENNAGPRTYVVGLPVIVTVTAEGFVTVEVDTAELATDLSDDNANVSDADAAQVAADAETLRTWAKGHAVTAQGWAK